MADQAPPSFEPLLTCGICKDRLTQPKALPCLHHAYCLKCLRGCAKNTKSIKCPTCHYNHRIPKQGVEGFRDDQTRLDLLSMICQDCDERKILNECGHCKQQVCHDCREAHIRLAAEIAALIESVQMDVFKKPEIVQTVRANLNRDKTERVEAHIHAAHETALKVLKARKDEMLRHVEFLVDIQRIFAAGTPEAVIVKLKKKLSDCECKADMQTLKESLSIVKDTSKGELEFYHVSDETSFGELGCGGRTVVKPLVLVSSGGQAALNSVIPSHTLNAGRVAGSADAPEQVHVQNTTDADRPSRNAKSAKSDRDKAHCKLFVAAKVRGVVHCSKCRKPRMLYSQFKLKPDDEIAIARRAEEKIYTCGSPFFPPESTYYNEILVREDKTCASTIETQYDSWKTADSPPVCSHCGRSDNIAEDAEIKDLRERFKVVRPICVKCKSEGMKPETRNKLGKKQKC